MRLSLIAVSLSVLGLSACTWVPMAPEAGKVRVIPAGEAVTQCEKRGEVTVSVTHSVAFYERNALRVRDELETMARNEAVGLSADAIKPLDEPYAGEQRFAAYRCGSVVPTRRTTPPSAPASQPLKLEEAETYPVRED